MLDPTSSPHLFERLRMKFKSISSIFSPGVKKNFEEFPLDVWVFPLGFRQFKRLLSEFPETFSKFQGEVALTEQDEKVALLKLIVENFSSILEECTVFVDAETPPNEVNEKGWHVKFDELPHHIPPSIASEWFELSFGKEEQVRPWKEAIGKIYLKVTKKKLQWPSILETFSKSLSPQDTPSNS